MPFQRLLDSLLSVPGVLGVLLLDSEGEVAIESGARDERHRLIGAYQGIALAAAARVHERYRIGATRALACRYAWGVVITRPLKDGYYLIVSIDGARPLAPGLRASAELRTKLDREL